MTLFKRVAALDVQPQGGVGLRAEQNRITFDVTKTHTEASNQAYITVYNLSASHRNRMQGKPADVRLFAGYEEGAGLEQLFVGQSDFVNSKREPPDVITIVEAQDGIRELREFRVSLSYKKGSTVQQVLQGIASKIGLPLRASITAKGIYPRGYSFLGPVREALDQVCRKAGLRWSIQDAGLLILERNKPAHSIGLLISPDTGMIGSAERINYIEGELDGDPLIKPQWKVKSLLQPRIMPSHRVMIHSAELSGTFTVEVVHHTGDTHGPEWYTELELRSV